MSIGFFHPLAGREISPAALPRGNPGMGGTPYLFLLTVWQLNASFGPGTAVLYTDGEIPADPRLPTRRAGSLEEAARKAAGDGMELLVVSGNSLRGAGERIVSRSPAPLAVWGHNTLDRRTRGIAARCDAVKWVVSVSEAQYRNMADTEVFGKCAWVNNCLPEGFFRLAEASALGEKRVAYLGSLYPQKGAHNLLDIWARVLREEPEAVLDVVGGAGLWRPSAGLGDLGVAEPWYERVLRGKLARLPRPDSVRFHGARSWDEIRPLLRECRAGVVNPSWFFRDETFCLSALELAAHGLPVVSRQRGDGLGTTVLHGRTGFLEDTDKAIAARLVALLRDRDAAHTQGLRARRHAHRFTAEQAARDWLALGAGEWTSPKQVTAVPRMFPADDLLLLCDKAHYRLIWAASGGLWDKGKG